jgi:hypothetical protein
MFVGGKSTVQVRWPSTSLLAITHTRHRRLCHQLPASTSTADKVYGGPLTWPTNFEIWVFTCQRTEFVSIATLPHPYCTVTATTVTSVSLLTLIPPQNCHATVLLPRSPPLSPTPTALYRFCYILTTHCQHHCTATTVLSPPCNSVTNREQAPLPLRCAVTAPGTVTAVLLPLLHCHHHCTSPVVSPSLHYPTLFCHRHCCTVNCLCSPHCTVLYYAVLSLHYTCFSLQFCTATTTALYCHHHCTVDAWRHHCTVPRY